MANRSIPTTTLGDSPSDQSVCPRSPNGTELRSSFVGFLRQPKGVPYRDHSKKGRAQGTDTFLTPRKSALTKCHSCLSPWRYRSRFQVGSDAGGIKAISRSVERSDTTGCDTKNATHPIGMPALPCCWPLSSPGDAQRVSHTRWLVSPLTPRR